MPHLAFFTYGTLFEEHAHASNDSFHELADRVYEQGMAHPGYVWACEDDWDIYPWWKTSEGWTGAQTLTLWSDLESVFRFAYSQGHPHGEALRRRKEWFLSHTHPVYVAWWVGDRHRPTWREGVDRIEHLDAHGTSPAAFSFRAPFDASGAPRARPRL
jgi:hypothetical protein